MRSKKNLVRSKKFLRARQLGLTNHPSIINFFLGGPLCTIGMSLWWWFGCVRLGVGCSYVVCIKLRKGQDYVLDTCNENTLPHSQVLRHQR
jgi:hypothetical protein